METGCSKHSVTHGESFTLPRICNQSRQSRTNKRWGVCTGGWGSSLAPVLLQVCVRWDEPTSPLHFRVSFWAEMPPLHCYEFLAKVLNCPFPPQTQKSTSLLPSLTSAFHSPGPGGTRCHWVVPEKAQWCKPDPPISSSDTPTAPQPTESKAMSTASLLSSFLSEFLLLKSPAEEKCSVHLAGAHKTLVGSHRPLSECSAEGRYRMCYFAPCSAISHTNLSDLPIFYLFLQPEDKQQPMPNAV